MTGCDNNTGGSPIPGISDRQFVRLVQLLGSTNDFGQVINPHIANMAGRDKFNNVWIIDSGASEYISCDRRKLKNVEMSGAGAPMKIPNGDYVPVTGVGDAKLPNGLEIKHALNVTKFECNLLSVSRLTKVLNCSLTFFPDYCVIQDLNSRNLIGLGKVRDGLYCVDPESLTRLYDFRELAGFKGGSGWSELGLLKNLNQLVVVDLEIELDNLDDKDLKPMIEDVLEAELSNKVNIEKLRLFFTCETGLVEGSSRMNIIDAPATHPNLRILFIDGYMGSSLQTFTLGRLTFQPIKEGSSPKLSLVLALKFAANYTQQFCLLHPLSSSHSILDYACCRLVKKQVSGEIVSIK